MPRLGSSSEIKEGFLIINRQKILPQMLLRSWPFPRGAGRIIDHFFSRLTFENEIETVRTTDGFAIKVFPNDLIGRHIYLTGEFDRSTVEVLVKLSKPDDVLLDIGANIGYVSGCFLQNVPRSKVIAVEPQPLIVDLLELISNSLAINVTRYFQSGFPTQTRPVGWRFAILIEAPAKSSKTRTSTR